MVLISHYIFSYAFFYSTFIGVFCSFPYSLYPILPCTVPDYCVPHLKLAFTCIWLEISDKNSVRTSHNFAFSFVHLPIRNERRVSIVHIVRKSKKNDSGFYATLGNRDICLVLHLHASETPSDHFPIPYFCLLYFSGPSSDELPLSVHIRCLQVSSLLNTRSNTLQISVLERSRLCRLFLPQLDQSCSFLVAWQSKRFCGD